MSTTDVTWQIDSTSSDHTEKLAEQIGKNLQGGEVVELISDLGGGKTTFVRGLARGMGSADKVSSPSFTISKVYKADRNELHHFDFYRLQEGGVMVYELNELLNDPAIVVVVEWADIVASVLPDERLRVAIQNIGESSRRLMFTAPKTRAYLMEHVC
jgi:tRNA threonylcarbamoyladenosine biosynthesis protein TsaE